MSVMQAGVAAEVLTAALDDFRAAIGEDAVLTGDGDLREFRDPYWFAGLGRLRGGRRRPAPIGRGAPGDRADRERPRRAALGELAGSNNGYGGSSPRVRGSVVVNLRRMNKVLEIDGDAAYAVVEPGVSFFDLYEAVRSSGHKLWISVPDLGWGSVIGNATRVRRRLHAVRRARPPISAAWSSCFRAASSCAPAWARSRTAGPGTSYRRSFGPSFDGLFFQSNFGIVTKAGVWLMPQPECFLPGWATAGATTTSARWSTRSARSCSTGRSPATR